MKRLWRWVRRIFTPPPNPLPEFREGESNTNRPLWVDAGLVGMKQEIGLIWREYPTVMEIYMVLPGVEMDDAEWIYHACSFDSRVQAMVTINDVARAVIGGVPITEIRRRGLMTMQSPPEWERKV